MKNKIYLTSIVLIFSIIITFGQGTCKAYIFSCPSTTGKICKNSKLFQEIENSGNGMEGIYTKDKDGCWVVSGSIASKPIANTAQNQGLLAKIRKYFGSNSLKPQN